MQKERPEDYGLFRAVALNAIDDNAPITKTEWRALVLARTPPEYFARRWEEAKNKDYDFTSAKAFATWNFAMLTQSFQKTGLITRDMPGKLAGTAWKHTDEWSARLTEKGRKAKYSVLKKATQAPVGSECRAVLPLRIERKTKAPSPDAVDLGAVVRRLEALENTMRAIRAAVLGSG